MDIEHLVSAKHNLPLYLIKAIVEVESTGDPYAWRFEPHYRYLVNVETGRPFRELDDDEIRSETAPDDFPYFRGISSRNTEWIGQQASWGPMQVMGAVAREFGFKEAFPKLCGEDGVWIGALHLARLRDRFFQVDGWRGVIAAYNAGSPRKNDDGVYVNQSYVDKVIAHDGLKGVDA